VVRALERFSGVDAAVITHRLMGEWPATADTCRRILSPDTRDADISRPYPFYLAYPLTDNLGDVGSIDGWQVEWKWKIDPLTADAVLIYAQRGHGRRAGLYTD